MPDIAENDLFEYQNNSDPEVETKLQTIIQEVNGLLEGYKLENDIQSYKDITQQEWGAVLMYIAMSYFKPTKILYKYIPGISNNGQIVYMYDYNILNGLCQYYIYICRRYNKISNISGFCDICGINYSTAMKWDKQESQHPEVSAIIKSLRSEYEKGLENGAQSGKNPVGYIAALNHRFGWSSEGKTSVTVNINRTSDQIMSTYNQNFIENNSENG